MSSNALAMLPKNAHTSAGVKTLFDERFYLSKYPDVAEGGLPPLDHYLQFGGREERDPHPLFSTRYYLEQCPELRLTGDNPLLHFLAEGASCDKNPCPVFDTGWYRQQYHQHLGTDTNPLIHYLQLGANSGFDPNPLFDTSFYVTKHPEVARARMNPLIHYLLFGADLEFDPSPAFDASSYLRLYPDVLEKGFNPLWHYLYFGRHEKRLPRLNSATGMSALLQHLKDYSSLMLDLHKLLKMQPAILMKAWQILTACGASSLPWTRINFARRAHNLINTFSSDTFYKSPQSLLQIPRCDKFHGFNGQFVRANILLHLIRELRIDEFWETGTHVGDTSLLIAAQTNIPVASCELNQEFFDLACKRLRPFGDRVELFHGDSRLFLQRTLERGTAKRPLIYLDAHWYDDLPLRKEIELITESAVEFLIVVDDFEVPTDPGFGYDVYGDNTFDWNYIRESVGKAGLSAFQPAYASQSETGCRRGFIVLARPQFAQEIKRVVPSTLLTEVH